MKSIAFTIILILIISSIAKAQTSWYVDDDTCPSIGSGTEIDPYCGIQEAINMSSNGDTILVSSGMYNEPLALNHSLQIIGSGSSSCTIHYHTQDTDIIQIENSDVQISGIELNGGEYNFGFFQQTSPKGIVSINSNLQLTDITINQVSYYMVRIEGGSLVATDIVLQDGEQWTYQCDVGFSLNSCVANFNNLLQESGRIDHTININNPPANSANVIIKNSTIRSSELSYGDCIRAYIDTTLYVANNYFYREPGGDPATSYNHTGVSINGYNNIVTVRNNSFISVPWGIKTYGSITNSNYIIVEDNMFENCEVGGIVIQSMDYEGVDLGGGRLGSVGNNTFLNTTTYDVKLYDSTNNIFAIGNSWSNEDPDLVIWDNLDDSLLGKVIYTVPDDSDTDGIPDDTDNCPNDYNPGQEDTYPPEGNGIGDACDCEADFTCDGSVDGGDVGDFLTHYGRSQYNNPCAYDDPCQGDFNCDSNVDGDDVGKFLEDFGRSQYYNPCPTCVVGDWCVY